MNKPLSVFRPGLFDGRVAVVTGGATGIGYAITCELVRLGCRVVIASRNEQRLHAVAMEINSSTQLSPRPAQVVPFVCNIRNESDVERLFAFVCANVGAVDFVVNNAGGQFLSAFDKISPRGFKAVVETNLYGTFYMCRHAFLSSMREHGGAIVNITVDCSRGIPLSAHSGAARSGVENLTRSLAVEWAEFGIRVNAVAPGSSIYSETAAANYGGPDAFSGIAAQLPTKRLGVPEEVSGVVCLLLSPASSFVSGATIAVDAAGRWHLSQFYKVPEHDRLPPFKSFAKL